MSPRPWGGGLPPAAGAGAAAGTRAAVVLGAAVEEANRQGMERIRGTTSPPSSAAGRRSRLSVRFGGFVA